MDASPDLSALHTLLEKTVGYQLIGAFISFALYGITVLQTYLYFSNFHSKDSRGIQSLVAILWIIDTTCSILVAHTLYFLLVRGWGDVSSLAKVPTTFSAENVFTVLLIWIVQLFLAHRVWLVSSRRDYVTPSLVVFMSAISFGAGTAMSCRIVGANLSPAAVETDNFVFVTAILEQGLAAAADIIATFALCFHLRNSKDSEQGFKRTNNIVNALMVYFINRGILTSILQVIHLATYTGLRSQQNWILWHLLLSKVYINSLLAILNARTGIQKKFNSRTATVDIPGIHRLYVIGSHASRTPLEAESQIPVDPASNSDDVDTKKGSMTLPLWSVRNARSTG